MRRAALTFTAALALASAAFAGDFLFVSAPYLKLTKQVIQEADVRAKEIFAANALFSEKYQQVRAALEDRIDVVQRKRLQKKITADAVTDTEDKAFADELNSFKDAINLMSRQSGKPLPELLPSYTAWNQLETSVVKAGLDKRLSAFETRFGPDSEPINVLELFIAEKFLPGDESGPAPWEPIVRFSAVQITSRGSSLTSGIEIGTNYYFVKARPPKPLSFAGISNHIGVAATLQYLEDPGAFNFKGRPSFGVMFHLDRKEAGVAWDNAERKFRLNVGYSFQFVPFVF